MKVFAGIEGGATHSKAVLIDGSGQILAWVDGGPLNYLLIGLDKCHDAINEMIERAKSQFVADGGPDFETLDGLGMGLSGCENNADNEVFVEKMAKRYPTLFKTACAVSDTIGSIYTASHNGGMVLISGTGSNSLLLNPDGTEERLGGWGYLLGDEGAGYWIAHRAIKTIIDHDERLQLSSYSTDAVRKTMFKHFEIDNILGLIPLFYTKFNKAHIAALSIKLATLADEEDELSQSIFYEAGKYLGKHVVGLLDRVDPTLIEAPGGLRVVCVGSVFKSWRHLKEGFFAVLGGKVKEMTLVRLEMSAALGCAILAAKKSGVKVPVDLSKNYQVFCHLKIENTCDG